MWQTFKNDLLKQRKLKIVSAFHCDPAVSVRPAEDADRRERIFHTHPGMREVLLVLDGECEYMIGDRIYRGGADTAIFVPPDVPHEAWYPADAPPGRHLWMIVMPNYLQYNLFSINEKDPQKNLNIRGFRCCSPHNHQQIVAAWDQAERDEGAPESLAELSLLVNLQAVRLVRLYQEEVQNDARNAATRNQYLVLNVKEYIDIQCGRDCSIDLLAKRFGCSRTHLTRIFRRHAGCSVLEYINRQRRSHYQSMAPDTPVKIFAQELGFSSASAFIHWRRQNVETAPRAGRDK